MMRLTQADGEAGRAADTRATFRGGTVLCARLALVPCTALGGHCTDLVKAFGAAVISWHRGRGRGRAGCRGGCRGRGSGGADGAAGGANRAGKRILGAITYTSVL